MPQGFASIIKVLVMVGTLLVPLLTTPAEASVQRPSCPDADRELYLTTPYLRGGDVLELQQRLQQLGFYHDACDGIYGRATAMAVINFHKKHHLYPTPRVTEATWEALAHGCGHPVNAPQSGPLEGTVSLVIDTEQRTLTVMSGQKVYCKFPVAVGKLQTPSPVGDWMVIDKRYDLGGAFGPRWLGLNVPWGVYGIHGTNKPWSIGDSASAGCLRMYNEDILRLYEWVPVGTRVKITGPPHWLAREWHHLLEAGSCGPEVVYVQLSLQKLGFYPYHCDSWYGYLTGLGVRSFQAFFGLPVTGKVDARTYRLLQEKGGIVPLPDPAA